MPDTQFERTFADLAFANLRDKAPGLLDYLLGFKLIDKNDEGTRAVGAFGFKVGTQNLAAPVFFINGELKGYELLFVSGQEMFVPLKENWVNYLINRRPYVLGEPEEETLAKLGPAVPDFNILAGPSENRVPSLKTASFQSILSDLPDDKKWMMRMFLMNPRDERCKVVEKRADLGHVMKIASPEMKQCLVQTMRTNPAFAEAVMSFYPLDTFTEMDFNGIQKSAADADTGGFIDDEGQPKVDLLMCADEDMAAEMQDLDATEKRRLMEQGYLVRDHRDDKDTSRVYNAEVDRTLCNPNRCGMYEVLLHPGRIRRVIAISTPMVPGEGRENTVVIVDPEAKTYGNFTTQSVWAKKQIEDLNEWDRQFDGLPGYKSIKPDDVFVLLNKKMHGTCVLKAHNVYNGTDGMRQISVSTRGWDTTTPSYNPHYDEWRFKDGNPNYDGRGSMSIPVAGDAAGPHLLFTDKEGDTLVYRNGDIFVPNGFKVIKLKKEFTTGDRIQPANLADLHMEMMKSGEHVKIYHDGLQFHVTASSVTLPAMNKLATLSYLLKKQGVRENVADTMIEAAVKKQTARFVIKKAGYAPVAPAFPPPSTQYDSNLGVNTQISEAPIEESVGMQATERVPNVLPEDQRRAQMAAEMGNKELFDVSILKGLVEATETESLINRYLSDIMLGMDRVGRILFLFYWHFDAFTERYGRQDMPTLEDTLKNVFESTGDLAIFLKQRAIESAPGQEEAEMSLQTII